MILLRLLKVSTNRYTGHVDFSPVRFYRAMSYDQFPLDIDGIILGGCKYITIAQKNKTKINQSLHVLNV